MKRNRNIRTLHNLNLLKHPPADVGNEGTYFGDELTRNSHGFVPSSDDSLETILTGVRDLGNSISSSSSLSWGDDCKSEASRQLRDELERMDRVLRGAVPIPDNYDREEYLEWMEFFPNLCVLNAKDGPCSADHCDKVETNDRNQSNQTVIDEIVLKGTPDLSDNYLRIGPFGGATRLTKRQSSSRSLISSQISSSKWLKDEEYTSLPFVSGGSRIGRNGVPKSILKNTLVLPPIDTQHYRLISAMPRRETKSLSALSVKAAKYSGLKRK